MFDDVVGRSRVVKGCELPSAELGVGASSKNTSSHAPIRWMAVAMTPWTWVVGIVLLTQFRGQPLLHAAMVAAVGAFGGLITWAIYHAISRRDDGMAIFILAGCALITPYTMSVMEAVLRQIAMSLAALFVLVVSTPLGGKLLRIVFNPLLRVLFRKPRVDDGQANDSPLFDREVDRPFTR
jgi:hypothetical protein